MLNLLFFVILLLLFPAFPEHPDEEAEEHEGLIAYKDFCRFLTRREIEQAQTLPLGYTDMLSYTQMQDVCGDGWTIDVIAHIFNNINIDK